MTTTVVVKNVGPYPVLVSAVDTKTDQLIDDPRNCILEQGQSTPEWTIWQGKSIKVTEKEPN